MPTRRLETTRPSARGPRPSNRTFPRILATAMLVGSLALACGDSSPSQTGAAAEGEAAPGAAKRGGRVLLIGIDGASPRVTGPMMKNGRLVNLGRLAREGVYGPLKSEHPLYSPRIWNSIATGKDPDEHGITAFVHQDDEGLKHLYMSYDRKVPALWNILSERGVSVGVVNWWTTYPPEKLDGVMVSDHFFPEQSAMVRSTFKDESEIAGALVHPPEWAESAVEARNTRSTLTTVPDPFGEDAVMPPWINRSLLSNIYATDSQVVQTALAVQESFAPQVMIVFLPGIDRVSHWLWGNLEPEGEYPSELRPDAEARRGGARALFDYYDYTDQLIGRLLEGYGEDDLVIILSDHGFEAQVSMMLLTGGHETHKSIHGVLYARGPGVPERGQPGEVSVLDVTPTVLGWLGIPPALDMRGKPMPFITTPMPDAIASYDGIEIERLEVEHQGAEAEIVEHLRALGYLEGEGVDHDSDGTDSESDGPTPDAP